MIIGIVSTIDIVPNKVNNSTIPEIVIAGIPIKKDSLAAVFLSIPENNAEVKVIPDLETPGKIARDWARPKKITSFRVISLNNFLPFPKISERAKNIAISREVIAMENNPRKIESEKFGRNNFIIKPRIKIGTLAINI